VAVLFCYYVFAVMSVVNSERPHILVVVNVFRPDLGGGVLFSDLCDGLFERGFDITVKCAYPYYPQWRDKSGQNDLRIRTEISDGYRVERHGLYIPRNPNSLAQRLIYEASFFLSLLRRLPRRGQFDAVLVICPLVSSVGYAALAARRAGAPLWLNVQDLSAQAATAGGLTRHSLKLEKIQNFFFRKASFWSSISESMTEVLQRIEGAPERVELIPNWLHASLGARLASSSPRSITNPDAPVRLFYSGNIGGKQNLLEWCKRLSVSDHAFRLRIHGDGGRAPELRKWITAQEDPRFEMRDLTDEDGLARALHSADFYVITEREGAGNSFIPSKLIPGMTSATPILAVCDAGGPLGQEVIDHGIGAQIGWHDDEAVTTFFQGLRQDPNQYLRWSENALERSHFYDRERGIDRCVQALETMTETSYSDLTIRSHG
jgi:colanic acid biosynthesis glycosyl transferase WcaI